MYVFTLPVDSLLLNKAYLSVYMEDLMGNLITIYYSIDYELSVFNSWYCKTVH